MTIPGLGTEKRTTDENATIRRACKTIVWYKGSSQATTALHDYCVRAEIKPLHVLQHVAIR